MRKVAVVGCGGSGKSYLALKLGKILDAPVTHLDAAFYDDKWSALPLDEFAKLQRKLVAKPQWVSDGICNSILHIRLESCDTVIHMDQDPGQAQRRFGIAIAGNDDGYARSRAISGTKLASLLMTRGDPQHAAVVRHRALDDAGGLTSWRAADDLKELGRFAARHRRLLEGAYLRDRISATLLA
ncbi:hypothetical protein [Streptomyces sp. Tue6028]|uniref:hypothetical protein n=1 Tax=Streptomyces sp. Tue6028 TaxID=2036037 RepID=UPI003D744182